MQPTTYPIYAREGWVHLVLGIFLALLATLWLRWWSIPVWLLVLFIVQFFRDPARHVSRTPGAVVSPASGKIVWIGEEANPYIPGDPRMQKISIFMNIFSVHSNLIPIGGQVRVCQYYPGQFMNAALEKSSEANERNAVWVQTDKGQDVVTVQIAGFIARRILCYVAEGEPVITGQRFGFIRFGSRVDLYLPPEADLQVTLHQWVTSGNDVVATLHAG